MFRRDYDLLAGMHEASSAALSCAELRNVAVWMIQAERRGGVSQPSRFRLFRQPFAPSVGVRPDRKLGPEEISREYRTIGVCAARNVA
jgi:hypothetical protein